MRKKILVSILSIIVIGFLVIGGLFISIFNYQHIEDLKVQLKTNNELIANSNTGNSVSSLCKYLENIYKESDIRVTCIDSSGTVVYDSEVNNEDNHSDREEFIQAEKEGYGSSIRYSSTLNREMLYCAQKMENGDIIRSAIPVDRISILNSRYRGYYVFVIFFVSFIAMIFAYKLIHAIVKPLNELQDVTSKIANGDFKIRAKINSKDEIGKLAYTFNEMADKLQMLLNEAVEKQNRLEAILKSMDSGVIAIDKNNKIIIMNPYAKKIFGINKDVMGKDIFSETGNSDINKIFLTEHEDYTEATISYPTDKVLRIKTADIINENLMIGTVAVVQDITDIKRLENMRSEFVANVSHELKTPLTSIKGFAETLKYVDDEENKQKFLNIINDEAERLTRLIEDILTLSNIEQHKDEISDSIDIQREINGIYYMMCSTAKKKNISICIERNDKAFIMGNRDRFKQMIINIVDNAIKYSNNNSKVWINSINNESEVRIEIRDHGVGISKEHIPRLFERFYRVDKARSRAAGGTGLGLAIVKHIIIEFKGKIEIESKVGEGSTFIITLPIS